MTKTTLGRRRYSELGESNQHKKAVVDYIEELKNEGWKAINLKGLSPDGIATKDGKLVAVEVLGLTYRSGGGWHNNYGIRKKKADYYMFDEVLVKTFKRIPLDELEK